MSDERTRGVPSTHRRQLIRAAGGALVLALTPFDIARGATLLAVRIWPADDYTRLTLEHDAPLKFSHFMVRDTSPLRLVVDIEDMDLTPKLQGDRRQGPARRSVHRAGARRPEPSRRRAARDRTEGGRQAAGVLARARRAVPAPARARPLSGQSARSAAGAAARAGDAVEAGTIGSGDRRGAARAWTATGPVGRGPIPTCSGCSRS